MPTGSTVRFLHSADWQLGMTRAFLGPEAAPRFSQARIDAIGRLGALAGQHQAAFIVVAGDVFESNRISQTTLNRAVDVLARIEVPVYLLPGNHDPLETASLFHSPVLESAGQHIHVIRDHRPRPVPGLPGVEVVGAPWTSKRPVSDPCAAMLEGLLPMPDGIRVAVCHGQVSTLAPDQTQPGVIDVASAEAALADGRIDYLALGDRHSTTRVGDSGRIWYPGAPVATAFDEDDPNNALLVELQAGGPCSVKPLAVGNWRFIASRRDLNGPGDLAQLDDWLSSLPDKECSIVKLYLTGTVSLETASELDGLLERQAPLFASLRRRTRDAELVVAPDALDRASVSLTGYARQTWEELLERAEDDDTARQSLQLLYRLASRGGRS